MGSSEKLTLCRILNDLTARCDLFQLQCHQRLQQRITDKNRVDMESQQLMNAIQSCSEQHSQCGARIQSLDQQIQQLVALKQNAVLRQHEFEGKAQQLNSKLCALMTLQNKQDVAINQDNADWNVFKTERQKAEGIASRLLQEVERSEVRNW